MLPSEYYQLVRCTFAAHGNPQVAQGQIAYMKNHFDFFGLKMPVWSGITKEMLRQHGMLSGEALDELICLCFADEHREMHYFALEFVQKSLKKQPPEWISMLEELILTNSWWDSVDWIAKLVGIHFKQHPQLILPITERWMASGEMWLQRVCIIFQLSYKEKTDTTIMFRYIEQIADSKQFFLQKAAGWALRQHSRTDPELVRSFVETHRLAPLTRREALRLMDKV